MVLSRYFTKGDYGTYQQVLYVYNTLLMVFTLGLPKAYSYFLPRVKNDEAKDVINKITSLFFGLGAIFSLTIFLGSPLIAKFLDNPELTKALKIFALVPFLMLPTMGLEGILATYRRTKFVAVYTATTRTIMFLFVVMPVVIWGGGYRESLIGFTLASAVAFCLALYLKYMPVRNEPKKRSEISYNQIFKFALPLLTASIWGILINSTDQFFISRYFGKEVFAEFSNGAIELPFATLIISASSTVLIPLFSRQITAGAEGHKEAVMTWSSVFKKAAMIIYPILFFCIFNAKLIMSVLYGVNYEVSGNYFAIKVVTNFVKVVPYAAILIAIGAITFYSKIHLYLFICLVPMEWLAVTIFNSPIVVTIVHSCFTILLAVVFIGYISKSMKMGWKEIIPLKEVVALIVTSLIASLVLLILDNFVDFEHLVSNQKYSLLFGLIFKLLIFGIVFGGLSFIFKLNYIKIIKPLLSKNYE